MHAKYIKFQPGQRFEMTTKVQKYLHFAEAFSEK